MTSNTATPDLDAREAELVRLGDRELAAHMYGLVEEVGDDQLGDRFYWALDEVFERFAPILALRLNVEKVIENEGERIVVGAMADRIARIEARKLAREAARAERTGA